MARNTKTKEKQVAVTSFLSARCMLHMGPHLIRKTSTQITTEGLAEWETNLGFRWDWNSRLLASWTGA